MELEQVQARVKALEPTQELTQDMIDWYSEAVEDGFEPDAYDGLSDEDLITDILVAWAYGPGEYQPT